MTAALAAPSVSLVKERTALYRFFRKDGVLLYVGVTNKIGLRWEAHLRASHWWPQAARVVAEWHTTRPLALLAVARAIREERPLFNSAGSPRPTPAALPAVVPRSAVVGDEWMTVSRVAALLEVSDTTARSYLDSGQLNAPVKAATLPSGHRRAHRDSVERLRRELYGPES